MARNRNKKQSNAGRVFPAPLAGVLFVAVSLALTYLWLCGRCDALGLKIKELEQTKVAVHRRVVNEEYKWSNMTSPQNMEKLLAAHNLNMTWPKEEQVVRVYRSVGTSLDKGEFAQNGSIVIHD